MRFILPSSRRPFVALLTVAGLAAALSAGGTARAATYNWLGNTGNWSDGTQWAGGTAPPANSIDTVLEFGAPITGTTYTSTDDAAENTTAFTLNGMIFDGTGTPIIAGASHSLTFVNNSSAASPFMSVNGTASNTISGNFSGIVLASGITLNLNGTATGQLSIGTVISGGGSLLINPTASSLFALTSPNTFTGGVTLSGGRMALTADSVITGGNIVSGSLGTGTLNWSGGAYVRTSTSAGHTIANAITISGNIGLGDNVVIANANQTLSLTGATTLAGAGTTYTFALAGSAATAIPVAFNGAISDGGGANGILINASGTTGGTVTFGGTAANTYTGTTTVGSTATTVASTLVLNKTAGTNAIAGNLTINNTGTVRLAASNQIADTSVVTLASTTSAVPSFDLNGSSETVASVLAGGLGNITNGGAAASTLTLNNVATGVTISTNSNYLGTIKDGTSTVALVKSGNDTLVLNGSGTNTYSGGTTLNSGAIAIGGTNGTAALGTGLITFNGGLFRGTNAFVGTLTNTVAINGDMTFGLGSSGGTTGTTTLSGATTLGGAAGTSRTFTVNAATAAVTPVALNGPIGDGGNVIGITLASGSTATLALAGVNTYTGPTTVNGGTLLITNNSSAATGVVTVGLASGTITGTLGGTGTVGGATTVNSKGMLSVGTVSTVAGTLTFNRSLTLGGAAAFDALSNSSGGLGNKGVSYDLANVTGALIFGGTLTLNLNGSSPIVGTQYDLFDFGSETGTFTSVSVTGGSSGFGSTFDYTTGILTLTAVPEPSTWVGLVLMLGALGVYCRRSRTPKRLEA